MPSTPSTELGAFTLALALGWVTGCIILPFDWTLIGFSLWCLGLGWLAARIRR